MCERIIWSSEWKNVCSHTSHSNVLMSMTHTHTHTHTHCLTVLCEEDQCPQGHSLHSLVPLMGREGAAQQVHRTLLHYGLQQQLCRHLGWAGKCTLSTAMHVYMRHQTHLTHTLCIKQYIRTYILYVHTCTNGCTYTYTHTHTHTCTHTHTLPHM